MSVSAAESDGSGRKTLPYSFPFSAFHRLRVSLAMRSSSIVTPGETIETVCMVAEYISYTSTRTIYSSPLSQFFSAIAMHSSMCSMK